MTYVRVRETDKNQLRFLHAGIKVNVPKNLKDIWLKNL